MQPSLCHHKPRSHTATLSVLDFRSANKWVPPSAHACNMARLRVCAFHLFHYHMAHFAWQKIRKETNAQKVPQKWGRTSINPHPAVMRTCSLCMTGDLCNF